MIEVIGTILWFMYQTAVHILAIVGGVVGFVLWEQGRNF